MKTKMPTKGHLIGGIVCVGAILLLAATMNAQAQYNYITLSVPGAVATYACGISGNDIVGHFNNGSSSQGFLYDGSSYITLSVPGAYDTFGYGIDGSNIVGYYYNATGEQGFLATPVPEPSVLALAAVGATTFLVRCRRCLP